MTINTLSLSLEGKRRIGAGAVLVLIVLFSNASAHASDPFAGNITIIDSGTKPPLLNVLRAGKNGFAQAKPGDAVFVGDTIKTGPDQKAQVRLSDNSTINIGPNSVLKMKAASLRTEDAKRSMVLKAIKGAIRFMISKSFMAEKHGAPRNWLDSNIVVEATTMIAGVRGTDFIIVVNTDTPLPVTEASVLEGVVTARNSDLKVKGAVTLSANETVAIPRGSIPPEASSLSQEHRTALLNVTTPLPANGFSGSTGQGERKATWGRYTESDMERDIAAGIALPLVFEQAVSSGMTVNKMVAAAIDAGVSGYAVVYTAVTEGYFATSVVDAAVTAGVPLVDVVAAAVIGGAETRTIIGGARLAGVSEEAIAAALSDYTSNLSLYGYRPPERKLAPGQIGPPPAIFLGGGGGATPSTRKASPYKP